MIVAHILWRSSYINNSHIYSEWVCVCVCRMRVRRETKTGTHIVFTFPHLTHKRWTFTVLRFENSLWAPYRSPFPLCILFILGPWLVVACFYSHFGWFYQCFSLHFTILSPPKKYNRFVPNFIRPDFHFFSFFLFFSPVFLQPYNSLCFYLFENVLYPVWEQNVRQYIK